MVRPALASTRMPDLGQPSSYLILAEGAAVYLVRR